MILSFKKTFPWGEPTNFEQKILDGTKIHSIRLDPHNRWKEGNKVHCATGVRTKNYNCFYKGVCTSIQRILILPNHNRVSIYDGDKDECIYTWISRLGYDMETFAKNDGFDAADDFFRWFYEPVKAKLIHWTDFKY